MRKRIAWGQNRPPVNASHYRELPRFVPIQPHTASQATVRILQQPPQLPINPNAIQLVQTDRVLDQIKCFFQLGHTDTCIPCCHHACTMLLSPVLQRLYIASNISNQLLHAGIYIERSTHNFQYASCQVLVVCGQSICKNNFHCNRSQISNVTSKMIQDVVQVTIYIQYIHTQTCSYTIQQ